jgi:predicted  nucleic acid-binding Zn-ribbon protein
MFDNPEIKKLRQDVDALSELVEKLIEGQESQHADVMEKLELIESKIEQEEGELSSQMEDIRSELEDVKEAATSIDEQLGEKSD